MSKEEDDFCCSADFLGMVIFWVFRKSWKKAVPTIEILAMNIFFYGIFTSIYHKNQPCHGSVNIPGSWIWKSKNPQRFGVDNTTIYLGFPKPPSLFRILHSLKPTFSHLKMDGWKTMFLLGWPFFQVLLLLVWGILVDLILTSSHSTHLGYQQWWAFRNGNQLPPVEVFLTWCAVSVNSAGVTRRSGPLEKEHQIAWFPCWKQFFPPTSKCFLKPTWGAKSLGIASLLATQLLARHPQGFVGSWTRSCHVVFVVTFIGFFSVILWAPRDSTWFNWFNHVTRSRSLWKNNAPMNFLCM